MTARPRRARAIAVLAVLAVAIVAANLVTDRVVDLLAIEIRPSNEHIVHRLLMIAAAAYTALIAVPFVPGIEIGISLLVMFGAKVVPLVYLCTLVGLTLGFLAGRLVPAAALQSLLADLSLRRASRFVGEIRAMPDDRRLELLVARAPARLVPLLLRHRYLAVALALNVPGNVLLGGGGGIVFLAGISRLFAPPAFLLTLALAIAPVPLAVLAWGAGILSG